MSNYLIAYNTLQLWGIFDLEKACKAQGKILLAIFSFFSCPIELYRVFWRLLSHLLFLLFCCAATCAAALDFILVINATMLHDLVGGGYGGNLFSVPNKSHLIGTAPCRVAAFIGLLWQRAMAREMLRLAKQTCRRMPHASCHMPPAVAAQSVLLLLLLLLARQSNLMMASLLAIWPFWPLASHAEGGVAAALSHTQSARGSGNKLRQHCSKCRHISHRECRFSAALQWLSPNSTGASSDHPYLIIILYARKKIKNYTIKKEKSCRIIPIRVAFNVSIGQVKCGPHDTCLTLGKVQRRKTQMNSHNMLSGPEIAGRERERAAAAAAHSQFQLTRLDMLDIYDLARRASQRGGGTIPR